MSKLEGKVAVVTASTRGIGYACVETLAKEGALVYMACRNLETGSAKASALCEQGLRVKTVYFEAYDKDSITAMVDTVVEAEGRLDILVNNFGGTSPVDDKEFASTKYDKFIGYVDAHLSTVFLASQEAVKKAMSRQKSGCIINIGSVAGITPDTSQVQGRVDRCHRALRRHLRCILSGYCRRQEAARQVSQPGRSRSREISGRHKRPSDQPPALHGRLIFGFSGIGSFTLLPRK